MIEGNWFGLSDDGTESVLRDDDPENGSGVGGIDLSSGSDGNTIQDNVFLGFDGTAVTIRGENNVFQNNLVGTKADGTVDKQTTPGLICTEVDWLGGGGLTVQGDNNQVLQNRFAGLRQQIFAISTQPSAIVAAADEMIIQENIIGVDSNDAIVGVCGRGIYLSGADDPEDNVVISNTIANPGMSAISVNGPLANGNTLHSNLISAANPWPAVEGNPLPENAIQLGPAVPEEHRNFVPAAVTKIDGTAVSGSSGANSPCPNCVIQLFLDDSDEITETLQLLGTTVVDGDGNWALEIPVALEAGDYIRTTSTSALFNTIPGMRAGTTTHLSVWYGLSGDGQYAIYLPALTR